MDIFISFARQKKKKKNLRKLPQLVGSSPQSFETGGNFYNLIFIPNLTK